MKIKELCESERPRERLFSQGAPSLSNGELMAVLLNTGNRGKNVVEMAQEVLSAANGSLITLAGMSLAQLEKVNGIGRSKAATLAACFELGRRLFSERAAFKKFPVVSPQVVYELMIPHLLGLDHEECWILFLNNAQYCTGRHRVSSGGLDSTIIDLKAITRMALDRRASFLILVHNHPSGSPLPSQEDLRQTQALKKALTPMGIGLMDHVIICNDCYYSFSDEEMKTVNC
ncbi:MAG: DNA repair protein RadC [Bacteroidales bacterium]|nr:DNA repair protein RadC [Bacteroidales bacterium]